MIAIEINHCCLMSYCFDIYGVSYRDEPQYLELGTRNASKFLSMTYDDVECQIRYTSIIQPFVLCTVPYFLLSVWWIKLHI